MKRNLTIRIPDDMRKALSEVSRGERVPVSEVVRKSIKRYVLVYRFRQLRRMVLPYAAKLAARERKGDLAAFSERANEPLLTFEELLKVLERRGKTRSGS